VVEGDLLSQERQRQDHEHDHYDEGEILVHGAPFFVRGSSERADRVRMLT
jgi:hypothetical protein